VFQVTEGVKSELSDYKNFQIMYFNMTHYVSGSP